MVDADPVLLSLELQSWAGERLARRGREYALLGRVESLRLSPDGRTVSGRVRGSRPTPYDVEVGVHGGLLASRCTCPFDAGPACKHAVAAVEALRFPRQHPRRSSASRRAGRTARGRGRIVTPAAVHGGTVLASPAGGTLIRDERLALAREEELSARRQRARKEKARVTPINARGGPPRFLVTGRDPDSVYTVTLRGRQGDDASCTCLDFAHSELATCKHILRVRLWYLRKKKKFPARFVSVWWKPREWILRVPDPLQELRVEVSENLLPSELGGFFAEDGWLREPPPGTVQSEWAREAVAAARRVAKLGNAVWELDPAVETRIAADEVRRRQDARLAAASTEGEAWSAIKPALGFDLHPYQEEGSLFLARRGRAFLADDMGLGKTVQAIAATLVLRRTAGARRALIVCPAAIKHQWSREIEKVCAEHAVAVEGGRASRFETYQSWREGFLVLNYELVLKDLDVIRATGPDIVILDEAQRIKNWETKTAKAIKRLESPYAFVLTGTPLENRLTELLSIVEFLHPRALGPRWRMLPFHALTDPTGRVLAYEGLDVLRNRLRGFFLRRERREVLDQLPDRTDNTFWTELSPAQRGPYRRYSSRIATLLANGRALHSAEVRLLLQALTSMRILCNALAQYDWARHERRVLGGTAATPADLRALQSPKLEEFVRLMEDLLEQSDSKVVVFSQWERMLRLAHYAVRGLLERRGERAEIFHGGLDARSRGRVLGAFRADADVRILFSTDAGGLGLNLQDSASIVVNLEIPWNPAVLEQRVGRVHRMGQRESVQVFHFVTKGALEERVRQVIENKRALFDGLLVDEVDEIVFEKGAQASFIERMRTLIGAGNGDQKRGETYQISNSRTS